MNNKFEDYMIGIINWYSEEKKYGVVSSVNLQGDIFLHHSNWIDKIDTSEITSSSLLIFKLSYERNKINATQCRIFNYSLDDFKVLMFLTKKFNHYLYVKDKYKNEVRITDLIENNLFEVKEFNNIINNEFLNMQEIDYIDNINWCIDMFGNILFNKNIIQSLSLKKFQTSVDIEFKKNLINKNYINLNSIEISFILEHFNIDKALFNKLKSHSEFLEYLIKFLKKTKDLDVQREGIYLGVKNNIQDIVFFIDGFINDIEDENNILHEINELSTQLSKSNIKCNLSDIIEKKIYSIDNLNLQIEAHQMNLIKINSMQISKYIQKIFETLEIKDVIGNLSKLIQSLENVNVEFDYKKEIKYFIESQYNYSLTKKAYEKKLLDFEDCNFIEKYISQIDLSLFKYIESNQNITNKIFTILENNCNQELIKYIITNLERFELTNTQVFFDIGVKRLSFFNDENQSLYLKKLFHLRTLNKVNFEVQDLSSFIDISIIKQAYENKNEIDFSTFLVIDLISKFEDNNSFLATHELIKSVLYVIQFTPTRKVKLDNFFDKCNGIASLKAYSDNVISTESFTTRNGTQANYLKVVFPYDANIVNDIKKIPVKKYYPDKQEWGVPLRFKSEIVEFGKKHNFLFRFNDTKSFYEDNKHILQIIKSEKEKPIGITYCCGQEAQKTTSSGNKFWWCNQNQCFQNNINIHNEWEQYTLYDFMRILNFDLLEKSSDGNFTYEIGLYTKFVTLLNRFNKLLERLYCKKCDHVLYPVETSNFHKFSITKFSCKNENCTNKDEEIYLNNCLNGQCSNIIDSRVSEQCPNGWYICDKCGSCCSHIAAEKRLKNLQINGGKVYPWLIEFINTKKGHLEKAEYYCCICGQSMTEYSDKLYKCEDCNIEYNHKEYTHLHKKYIHLDYRVQNYPKKSDMIIEDLKIQILKEKKLLQDQGRTKGQIFGILFNKEIEVDGVLVSLKSLNNRELTNEIF